MSDSQYRSGASMKPLAGRTALITGANKGLGAAIAVDLARAGARIVVAVRDTARAGAVRDAVAAVDGKCLAVQCDVARAGDAEKAVADVLKECGALDILVNNAGQIEPIGHVGDTDPAVWEHAVAVNLFGPYRMIRAVLPHFVSRGGGTIVNISSGAAHNPREGWSAYCSAKAGLAMLTRATAGEYAARGLRTFGFQPGVVDTDMQVTIRASGMNEISRLRRDQLAAPEVPARWVTWLCTERPEDLDGKDFSVNDATLKARLEQWQGLQAG